MLHIGIYMPSALIDCFGFQFPGYNGSIFPIIENNRTESGALTGFIIQLSKMYVRDSQNGRFKFFLFNMESGNNVIQFS